MVTSLKIGAVVTDSRPIHSFRVPADTPSIPGTIAAPDLLGAPVAELEPARALGLHPIRDFPDEHRPTRWTASAVHPTGYFNPGFPV
jgi:hypothetical protein